MSASDSHLRAARNGADLKLVRRGASGRMVRGGPRRVASAGIAAGIVILAVVFAVLLEQVVLAQSAFKLKRIQDELVGAEAEHRELLLEAARLESSVRIERFARERLGMVRPDPHGVGYIEADVGRPDGARVAADEITAGDAPAAAVGAP